MRTLMIRREGQVTTRYPIAGGGAMKRAIATILLATIGSIGFAEGLTDEQFKRDPGRFIEYLVRDVPGGSQMQKAYEYVESRGFGDCVPHEKSKFSSQTPEGDFVVCSKVYDGTLYELALFHEGRSFRRAAMKIRPATSKKE